MRHLPLISFLVLAAATSAVAAPWSRLKSAAFGRAGRSPNVDVPWVDQREIEPYLIRSEFPLRDVQELIHELGDLQADVERTLNLKCQPQEIQIHLFNSKRSYDQYLSIRVPEGTKRQALYVPGTDAG